MDQKQILEPQNKTDNNILVILPIPRDKVALENINITNNCNANIHFLTDDNFQYETTCVLFDVEAYVNHAINYVKENNIKGIIYSHDMASLIAAIVCEKTGLLGPSLDSVFLACHKYYSRQRDYSSVDCRVLDIYEHDLNTLRIKYPCYVKPPCLMNTYLQFVVNNENEMLQVLEIMKNELPLWSKMFFDFFKLFISEEKYPYAHKPVIIIEELVSYNGQATIEGWVDSKGTINIWAISDINYHKNDITNARNYNSMPTSIPESIQAQIVALTTQVVINHGISNGFFNVDVWHWYGQKPCKVIEVNARSASLYHLMHKKCFNSELYKAMLFLCLGKDSECYLESPIAKTTAIKPVTTGALFFVITFGKGVASSFIDFDKVKQMQNNEDIYGMELFVHPKSIIKNNGTAGFKMAKFYIFGNSLIEISKKADYWRSLIVKNPNLSPYKIHIARI